MNKTKLVASRKKFLTSPARKKILEERKILGLMLFSFLGTGIYSICQGGLWTALLLHAMYLLSIVWWWKRQ
jgi:hypothetical protein